MLLFIVPAILPAPVPRAVQADRFPLRIEVTDLSPRKGPVMVALFESAAGFPLDAAKTVYREKVQPLNGKAELRIDGLRTGTYAVAVFHDTNDDGQLNLNLVGAPKEGYGFSNNVRNRFSAPRFSQASFRHEQETRLRIKIHY